MVMDYLTQTICGNVSISIKRLDRAMELLQKKNELTIREVAWECGFEDPCYFSRVFKKKTGQSPQKYLESHITDTSDQILNAGDNGGD